MQGVETLLNNPLDKIVLERLISSIEAAIGSCRDTDLGACSLFPVCPLFLEGGELL